MNRSPNTKATDRLVDYFAVVGPGEQLVVLEDGPVSYATPSGKPHPFKTEFGATTLDRYPLEDYSDTPFPTGVSNFCFPIGIRLRRPTPPDEPLPTFFSFIATGGKAESMFGHVLTFWEKMTPAQLECFDNDVGAATSGGGEFFAPKAFCLLSRWDFGVEFRTILTELYRTSVSPSPLPLERFITNITTEIPLPPAGRVEVIYQIGTMTVNFRRPPKNRLVSPLDLPFREVFECLDTENILTLMKCVLLEKQVLLISSQLSLLTATTEVIVALIYPFKWCHTVIPVLPRGLMEVLQSPMPFILGLHVDQWREAIDDIPPWVVQVDLDRNTIMTQEPLSLPKLGEKMRRKLLKALQVNGDVFAHRGADWASARLPNFDSAFNFAARPSEAEGTDDNPFAQAGAGSASAVADEAHDPGSDEDERKGKGSTLGGYIGAGSGRSGIYVNWHAVRRAFFRIFVSMVMRYRDFIIYPSNTTVPADGSHTKFQRRFNKEAYLAAVPADSRDFVERVLTTQAFANFIDDRIQPDASTDVDVVFVDESIDQKHNRSVFALATRRETPFLNSVEYRISKTIVARQPDASALPPGQVYRYTPLPKLDRTLYGRRREVPVIADAPSTSGTDYLRLRRVRGSGSTPSATSADDGSSPAVRVTAAENIYMAWFILFSASLDVIGAEVGRVAGEVFDITERAAAIDAMLTQQAEAKRLLIAQETVQLDQLTAFASPVRHVTVASEGRPAATLMHDGPMFTVIANEGATSAVASSQQLGPSAPASPSNFVAAARSQKNAIVGGNRASTRTPALLRRETAVTTARGLYFSQQLEIAFSVRERMVAESVPADEAVYRALLDICGRCGNFGKAYSVMDELKLHGIAHDASLYRTLFHAFFASSANSAAATQTVPLGALGFGGNRVADSANTTPGTTRKGYLDSDTPSASASTRPLPSAAVAQVTPQAVPRNGSVAAEAVSSTPAPHLRKRDVLARLFGLRSTAPQPPRTGSTAASLVTPVTSVPPSVERLDERPPAPESTSRRPGGSDKHLVDAGALAVAPVNSLSGGSQDRAARYAIGTPSLLPPSTGVSSGHQFSDTASGPPSVSAAAVPSSVSPTDIPRRRLDTFLSADSGISEINDALAAASDTHPNALEAPAAEYSPFVVITGTSLDRYQPVPVMDSAIRSMSSGRSNASFALNTITQQAHHGPTSGAGTPGLVQSARPPLPTAPDTSRRRAQANSAVTGSVAMAMATATPQARHSGSAMGISLGLEPEGLDLASPLVRASAQGSMALAAMFPGLTIDTMRETCPTCNHPLTDTDIRAGWTIGSNQDYTTVCPVCPPVVPDTHAVAVRRPSAMKAGVAIVEPYGARNAGAGVAKRQRFVARFSVTSMHATWRGSAGSGPGSLLFCEYLPPAVLVKELQTAIAHGHVSPALRQACPSLFWNLCLWLLSFALPADSLAHLSRSEELDDLVAMEMPRSAAEGHARARSGTLPGTAAPLGADSSAAYSSSDALRAEAEVLLQRLPSASARTAVKAATSVTQAPASAV